MSTYYWLVCDKCKESSPAASRTAGGYCQLHDQEATLIPFVIVHHECHAARIVSEHDEEPFEYERWTRENVDAMYYKDRP